MKKNIVFLLLLLAFFLGSKQAFANILGGQLDNSTLFQSCASHTGTGCSSIDDHSYIDFIPTAGTLGGLQFEASSAVGTFTIVEIFDHTTSTLLAYFAPANYVAGKTDGTGSTQFYNLTASDFSSAVTFNGTDTYEVFLAGYTTSLPCSIPSCFYPAFFNGSASLVPYVSVADTPFTSTPVTISSLSNTIVLTSPTPSQVIPSPYFPTFSGSYNYVAGTSPHTYDKMGFSIVNTNDLVTYSVDPVDLSTASGTFSFNLTFPLPVNKSFSFNAYFYDSTDATVPTFQSTIIYFSTGNGGGLIGGPTGSSGEWSQLIGSIQNKPPFGYISGIISSLSNVNDTETSAFTLQHLTILDTYIFTPIRDGIVWVLWIGFAFIFYKRLKDIIL